MISSPAELEAGLERAIAEHEGHYRDIQRDLFAQRIEMTETPASIRAAAAIRRIALDTHRNASRAPSADLAQLC